MCEGAGGVTWNATDSALVVVKDDGNHEGFVKMDRDGQEMSKDRMEAWSQNSGSMFEGVDDIVHHSGNRYYVAKGSNIYEMNHENSEARSEGDGQYAPAVGDISVTGIRALAIAPETVNGTAWNYLYFASTTTDKVYRSSIPSGIDVSTDVRGMTRMGDAQSGYDWWLAVDGTPTSYLSLIHI